MSRASQDAGRMFLAGIAACLTSLEHPDNLPSITPEQRARLRNLYIDLLQLQQEVVGAARPPQEGT